LFEMVSFNIVINFLATLNKTISSYLLFITSFVDIFP
jgi:hypothetical protein